MFLLLLATLLPIRGAVAGAMLCPMGSMQKPAVAAMAHGDGGCGHEEPAPQANDACNLCAAFCSLTPLPTSLPPLAAPISLASTTFPALAVPAPTALPSGLERPPRTC